MSEERKAVVLLVLTAVLWSTSGVLIKAIRWNPMAIAGTRSAITAAVLLAFVRRRNFTWSAAQLGGAVAYAGTVVLFVVATKLTTAHNAILLQYTAPIHIALFGPWFLNERAHWFDWLVIALLLGGMVLFFLDKLAATGTWGNLLAIASGVSFGWMTLFLRKQKAASPLESIFLGNVLAAAVCCPFIFGSMPRAGGSVALGWVVLACLGAFQLGVPAVLYSIAIKRVTALEAMLIPAAEAILNPIWVACFHPERPGRWALAGGAIVLGAVVARAILTARGNKGPERREGAPSQAAA